jgi:hypothetical protein
MSKLKLKRPLDVEGKPVEEFDLGKLKEMTGADFVFCTREAARKTGEPVVYVELDEAFRLEVMAKATGIDPDVLKKLRFDDFAALDRAVRNFLIGTDSE